MARKKKNTPADPMDFATAHREPVDLKTAMRDFKGAPAPAGPLPLN